MTLWEAYLILLSRLGLGPRPRAADGTPLELPSLDQLSNESFENPALQPSASSAQMPLIVSAPLASARRTMAAATTAAQLEQMSAAMTGFKGWGWVGLPLAAALAVTGQWNILQNRLNPLTGLLLLVLGTLLFVFTVWRGDFDFRSAGPAPAPQTLPLPGVAVPATRVETRVRWRLAAMAVFWSALAYFATGGNNFSMLGRVSWIISLWAWVAAFWQGSLRTRFNWRELLSRVWHGEVNIRLTRTFFALLAILALSASFRFEKLNEVPIEMTSDHVEKLIDVNGILNEGKRPVFEPGNGGREAMEFYLAALTANYLGAGFSHLTLKLVTSLVGFLTLPFIFLLVREMTADDAMALLATAAAGLAWWPNVISRNGLRFPFAPFFGAMALWLIVRAIKRDSRNSALMAGLALGLGLYGYTPIRAVPIAALLAFGLYALHRRDRGLTIKLAKWSAMLALIVGAAFVPMLRFGMDNPDDFWRRSLTRITGDPENPYTPSVADFFANEWNSIRMFSWTVDTAWLISTVDQPALDWVMAGLFTLGVGFLLYRYVRHRDWLDLFLLLAIPVLLLPSTLALAFPIENPSLHRSGAAIPIVFAIVAIPLRLLIAWGRKLFASGPGAWRGTLVGVALAALALYISWQVNWRILFVNYAEQYKSSVPNASELGHLVRAWADSTGSYDTVAVVAYPYWVDTRAVGIYATGDLSWNNVILNPDQLGEEAADPRSKLYILYKKDVDSIARLRQIYPQGKLAYHSSQFFDKEFLTFFVPGIVDFDETTLPPPQP
jgi:hypothetical protein